MIDINILKRKSIRDFNGDLLSDEEIISLFEAARLAPSAFNEQPWRFIAATKNNNENFNAILETLADKNQEWARNSSLLVIVLAKKILSKNQTANRHYLYDTASAVSNLTFQANSLDIYVHQMGGFDSVKVVKNFNVPDYFEVATVMAIGRKNESLHEENADRKTTMNRLTLDEILFEKSFGKPSSLIL
jgi:nitroreductase